MNADSRVLAVIDPDAETHRAIERGALFATKLGLPLELLDVVYDQFVEHDEKAVKSLLEHRRQAAEALGKFAGGDVEKVSIEVRWGRSMAEVVNHRVEETRPALVVKNTNYHSVLERTLLSNADWELIRHCPAPLVLVKDRDLSSEPKFLAAIDPVNDHDKPEALDREILSVGKQLSTSLKGSLNPVHVLASAQLTEVEPVVTESGMVPGTPAMPNTVPLPSDEIAVVKRERRELIDQLATAAGLDPDDNLLIVGDPASSLIERAVKDQVDFVVMGAVARGIIDRILIGHTAERILDRLPCDMIVIKPPGEAA